MKQLYKDVKELQDKIDNYIAHQTTNELPLTYTGLSYFLGFASRQSLWEYSKRNDDLSLPVKRAMLRIEQSYEEHLVEGNATGSIFALKNRGWRDKTELEHSTIDSDGKPTGFNFVDPPKKK